MESTIQKPLTSSEAIGVMVNPRSVALVGITVDNPEHWTRTFLDALLAFGFERPLYLVNPKGGEIKGRTVHRSLDEVPGSLDYVVSTVPARVSPALVRQCASKGVRVIHFCTAGFSETGTPEGIELERQLLEAARETGVRLIGPNCMGIYSPASRFAFEVQFPREPGTVGFISQSGGNVNVLVGRSQWRGVRFSKAVSYGNAADINECDLLEYLAEDRQTEVIAAYVEGPKDGLRFRRVLEAAARRKPVIILKGGVTSGGARAAAGHTGSLAGSETTWLALCRQAGAIPVSTIDEMIDLLVAFRFMKPPRGTGALVVGGGGGASVLVTDLFEKNGLRVPPLSRENIEKIRAFSSDAGNILRNPIDYSQSMFEPDKLEKMVGIALAPDDMDMFIYYVNTGAAPSIYAKNMRWIAEQMLRVQLQCTKPVAAVIEPSVVPEAQERVFAFMKTYADAGVPVFTSFDGAARAISAYVGYHRRRSAQGDAN